MIACAMTTGAARSTASALLLAFGLCWSIFAAAQVPVPLLTGHVIDQTGTLTAEQKISLEQTLTAFEARKGSQLAVLIVASTAPEAIEQYALRVAVRKSSFGTGVVGGVQAVTHWTHFPADDRSGNELPDKPLLM